MRYPASIGIFIFVGLFFFTSISSGQRLTNYEIFRAQVDALSGSIGKTLTDWKTKEASYQSKSGEIEMYVRQRIEEQLLGSGFRIRQDSSSVPQLKVSVPLIKVVYSSPVASHIFASSDVERTVQSDYDIEITDSGEVKFAKSYSFVYSDTVKESEISDLESGSYSFLHGKIDPGGFFDAMFQPVLFIASAAVIVYLFFTLRGS